MRISDWSSDVCSSDLRGFRTVRILTVAEVVIAECDRPAPAIPAARYRCLDLRPDRQPELRCPLHPLFPDHVLRGDVPAQQLPDVFLRRQLTAHLDHEGFLQDPHLHRSEEHTSELQSLMRISYAVFC